MPNSDPDLETRILKFFNEVTSPWTIVNRIQDDPRVQGSGRGISSATAWNILNAREGLPGKQFRSLEQIDSVRGVGFDTIEDILYSFGGPAPLEWRFQQERSSGWEARILVFFNGAQEEVEITQRIRDDPSFRIRSSRAWGVRNWWTIPTLVFQ